MADLLIEVRCEELPANLIGPAADALVKRTVALLDGLEHGEVRGFSTPRRLAVSVAEVAASRPVVEALITGPPLAAAQRDGAWTKAALGFARGKGVAVDDLQIVDGPKGQVIAAHVREGGESTAELIGQELEKLILGLPFKKSMRWGSGSVRWGRPIHQIIAVFGGTRVPAQVAGIETTTGVVGHRRRPGAPIPVHDAKSYVAALRERRVLVDRDERLEVIRAGLLSTAVAEGLEVDLDHALLEEVTDLVEWPQVVVGGFDEALLDLPARLLITSMRVHQRYFPTLKQGALQNRFLIVTNNPDGDATVIAEGNRRVLAARFHDATFFFAEDKKAPLAVHAQGLQTMRWVRKLGTMAEKQGRVATLGRQLAERLGASGDVAREAGALCKADLLTHMVGEFPELQGHMGRLYALHEGRSEAVAMAIEEHYMPRHSGDLVPQTLPGQALALADRLDTLCGCFSIGLKPKGSADPQGLRRAANGVVAVLLAHGHRLPLGELLDAGSAAFEGSVEGLHDFIVARFRATLMADGHRTDVVDAVLAAGGEDLVQLAARVRALSALSDAGEFSELMVALRRVQNISKDHGSTDYDASLFLQDEERALQADFEALRAELPERVDTLDVETALQSCIALKPRIDDYFDEVMVNCEDPALRTARLGLVRSIAQSFSTIADFRHISTE